VIISFPNFQRHILGFFVFFFSKDTYVFKASCLWEFLDRFAEAFILILLWNVLKGCGSIHSDQPNVLDTMGNIVPQGNFEDTRFHSPWKTWANQWNQEKCWINDSKLVCFSKNILVTLLFSSPKEQTKKKIKPVCYTTDRVKCWGCAIFVTILVWNP
jgi:hypothetical protein